MEKKLIFAFIVFFVISPFAKAEWDKDYSDRRLSEEIGPIKRGINNLTKDTSSNAKEIKALNERIQKLESDVSRLQEKVNSLWDKGAKNLDALDTKVKGTDKSANIALWISLSIVLSVCGILCLVFWPRKSKSAPIRHALSDKHKCPRCGWEHAPEDTVCTNPKCRCQF